MSRDAGGIYLHAPELACSEIAREIEAYWTARGAFRVERDPYLVPAFDAKRTGVLSISLAGVSPAWFLVRDSERYACDWELARALHEALGVEVLAYTVSESVARAHAMRWYAGELSHEREPARVEALLAGLPGAFEVLPNARPLEDAVGVEFLTFDGIGLPSELPSSYAGPDLDSVMGRSLLRRKARSLLTQGSLELPKFLEEYPFLTSPQHCSWRSVWAQYDAKRDVERDDGDEPDDALAPLSRKIIIPGVGIELEGLGMMSLDVDLDELTDLVGEVGNYLDAHGIYHFAQVGLLYHNWDGPELRSFVEPHPTTIVAGVDLWSVPAREAVAQVWEALDEEPWYVHMGGGDYQYVYSEAKLTLAHYPKTSGGRLTWVVVRRTLHELTVKDLEKSLRVSEAERAIRAAEQAQREQAMRSYFARLDRQLADGLG